MPRASYKPRADGRYCLYYKGKGFYGTTVKEAEAKRKAYIKEEEAGLRRSLADQSFAEYAAAWLPVHRAHVSKAVYNNYAVILERACTVFGRKRICDVVQSDVQAFINQYEQQAPARVKHCISLLRSLFRSAMIDGAATRDPCLGLTHSPIRAGTHRALTREEIAAVVAAAETHPFGAAVMLMLFAGLRRGEALGLEVDRDIDFDARTITVRGGLVSTHPETFGSGKTENSQRVIPLPDILADFLIRHDIHSLPFPGVKYFYPSFSHAGIALESFTAACGVRFRLHDLRHTYTVLLFDSGVDMKTAQTWLGHADPTMIMRIYDHLSESRRETYAHAYNRLASTFTVKTTVTK